MATVRTDLREGGVCILTLDRPPANAIDETLRTDLAAALDTVRADDAVRAVVLTGAGKFFWDAPESRAARARRRQALGIARRE